MVLKADSEDVTVFEKPHSRWRTHLGGKKLGAGGAHRGPDGGVRKTWWGDENKMPWPSRQFASADLA